MWPSVIKKIGKISGEDCCKIQFFCLDREYNVNEANKIRKVTLKDLIEQQVNVTFSVELKKAFEIAIKYLKDE